MNHTIFSLIGFSMICSLGCGPIDSFADAGPPLELGEPCISQECDPRGGNCKPGHITTDGRCCTGCTDETGACRDGFADAEHCGSGGEFCLGCHPDWCGAPVCVSAVCGFDPYPQGTACGDSDDPKFYCTAEAKCCTSDTILCY